MRQARAKGPESIRMSMKTAVAMGVLAGNDRTQRNEWDMALVGECICHISQDKPGLQYQHPNQARMLNIMWHIDEHKSRSAKSADMDQSSYLRQTHTAEMEPLSTGVTADHGRVGAVGLLAHAQQAVLILLVFQPVIPIPIPIPIPLLCILGLEAARSAALRAALPPRLAALASAA